MKFYMLARNNASTTIPDMLNIGGMSVFAESEEQARSLAHQEALRIADKQSRKNTYAHTIAQDWLDPKKSTVEEVYEIGEPKVFDSWCEGY